MGARSIFTYFTCCLSGHRVVTYVLLYIRQQVSSLGWHLDINLVSGVPLLPDPKSTHSKDPIISFDGLLKFAYHEE